MCRMAKRKKKEETFGVEEEKQKFLGIFDHLKHVQNVQDPHYFDKISDGDKKSWTNWLINKFLSMIPEYIELLNEVQHLSKILEKEEYYRVLIMIIPKRNVYAPFIKGKSDKYPKSVMLFLAQHYRCSIREINDYLEILTEDDIKSIYYTYGNDQKQTKKLLAGDEDE